MESSDIENLIKSKAESLREQLEWLCVENDAEDYQFEEYYKLQVLEEILHEIGELKYEKNNKSSR